LWCGNRTGFCYTKRSWCKLRPYPTSSSCRHVPDIGSCLAIRVSVLDYLLWNRNAESKKKNKEELGICYHVSRIKNRACSRTRRRFFTSTKMFGRLTLSFIVVSIVALFCAQAVEATKGPKITNRLYFDIKHGDEDLGRSMCLQTHAYW